MTNISITLLSKILKKAKSLAIYAAVLFLIFLSGCKKDLYLNYSTPIFQNPTIRLDNYFPKGVLEFKSKESLRAYWDSLQANPRFLKLLTPSFRSFNDKYEAFYKKENSNSLNASTVNYSGNNTSSPQDVSNEEFLIDLNSYALPAEPLSYLVNEDLQIIVQDHLFQFTRVGVLEVGMSYLDSYKNIYQQNFDNINYDQNFNSFPGEVMVEQDVFQIAPGIRRIANISDEGNMDIFQQSQSLRYLDDNGGTNGDPTPTNNDYFLNYKDPSYIGLFGEGVAVQFNDWAKRRFVFKVQNIKIPFLGIIGQYAKMDIKAKVQREKKFLFIKYWGPSFADQIVVGCDNMEINTNHVFAYPQKFSNLSKPEFTGISELTIGNHIVNALNIRVNLRVLGYTLDNSQLSDLINGQLNQLVGQGYQNVFREIEKRVINKIDPSYLQRYATYTTMLERLNTDNTLKIVLGKAEKPEGYTHANEWIIDQNIGFSWKVNGGVGGYPLKYWYDYFPKGSFYGKIRTGNTWRGLRILITK